MLLYIGPRSNLVTAQNTLPRRDPPKAYKEFPCARGKRFVFYSWRYISESYSTSFCVSVMIVCGNVTFLMQQQIQRYEQFVGQLQHNLKTVLDKRDKIYDQISE